MTPDRNSAMSTGPAKDVAAQDWHNAVAEARNDGFDYFDWLGCVDDIGRSDTLRVVLMLRRTGSFEAHVLTTRVPRRIRGWTPSGTSSRAPAGTSANQRSCSGSSSWAAIAAGCCWGPTPTELHCGRMRCWRPVRSRLGRAPRNRGRPTPRPVDGEWFRQECRTPTSGETAILQRRSRARPRSPSRRSAAG
jgi:hypothetical protein